MSGIARLIVALSLVAAACSSGSSAAPLVPVDDPTAPPQATQPTASSEPNTTVAATPTATAEPSDLDDGASAEPGQDESGDDEQIGAGDEQPEERVSPLGDVLGLTFGTFDVETAEEAARQLQLDIQDCMLDLGFDYTPRIIDSISPASAAGGSLDPDAIAGTAEFAARYGYGISLTIEQDLSNFRAGQTALSEDPNALYLESLSAAGRDAYRRALYGDESAIASGLSNEDARAALLASGDAGCTLASEKPPAPQESDRILAALEEEFGNFYLDIQERVASDPRTIGLTDQWVDCMRGRGYDYQSLDDAPADIRTRTREIAADVFGAYGPANGIVLEETTLDAMSEAEVQEYFSGFAPLAPEITPELQAELDRLLEFEIVVATDDLQCADGFDEIRRNVWIEYEQRFVDENQGTILALLEQEKARG